MVKEENTMAIGSNRPTDLSRHPMPPIQAIMQSPKKCGERFFNPRNDLLGWVKSSHNLHKNKMKHMIDENRRINPHQKKFTLPA